MAHDESKDEILQLPTGVTSRVDVGRLCREAEGLHAFLAQAAIRQPGTPVKLPRSSKLLDEMIQINKLNVLHIEEVDRLNNFLKSVHDKAPVLHMSFSADPSPLFMQKLMTWLRLEIHPLVLVSVGLQPGIGAGCVVRTNSKYFDFSLRHRFIEREDMLMQRLKGDSA